jgi:hypothetical protein
MIEVLLTVAVLAAGAAVTWAVIASKQSLLRRLERTRVRVRRGW